MDPAIPSYADLLPAPFATLTAVQRSAPFRLLCVRGPDAVDFVHRLSTQDVAGMAVGAVLPAAFLSPKGKLETLVSVGREADTVWIEAQSQDAARLGELLERYHFTERLSIALLADRACAQLVGAAAWATVAARPGLQVGAEVVSLVGGCRGLQWVRWHALAQHLPTLGEPPLSEPDWQVLRVAAGLAWVGTDVDASNLGLEAAIDDHVSVTKGCYTGQEIVARIHTYGHVNRRLVRARVAGTTLPAAGASVIDADGDPVGRLTSIAPLGDRQAVALAMLPHELATAGTQLQVDRADLVVA